MQLAQRRLVAVLVARSVDVVDLVVAADVLERRDAVRKAEAVVIEWKFPDVGYDVRGLWRGRW